MISFKQIQSQLGSRVESNDDISNIVGWNSSEIFKKTGISTRYISTEEETAEHLAILATSKIDPQLLDSCDLIISVTNTQEIGFPSISHIVHSEFGLSKHVKCIGINAGCTGFVDAVELAYAYFESDFSNNALIINSDTYSKFLGNERSTRTLFSDGATATVLKKNADGFKIQKKIASSVAGTYQYLKKEKVSGEEQIFMNGPQVLKFAMSNVLKDLSEISYDNKAILLPHQAGKLVLDLIEKKLSDTFIIFKNYEEYGNLVSASIPNLIKNNFDLLEKDSIVLSGFGVGLAHNCILLTK